MRCDLQWKILTSDVAYSKIIMRKVLGWLVMTAYHVYANKMHDLISARKFVF